MEIIFWLIVLALAGFASWKFIWPKSDINNDGKVDTADIKTVDELTSVLNVNNDNNITKADVTVAVEKTATKTKQNIVKISDKTSTKVKKPAAKKAVAVVKKAGRPKTTV